MTWDGLLRPDRRQQHVRARRVLGHVRLDLVGVERAAGVARSYDRPLRDEAEREPEVAELEVEVDDRRRCGRRRRARRRGWPS